MSKYNDFSRRKNSGTEEYKFCNMNHNLKATSDLQSINSIYPNLIVKKNTNPLGNPDPIF